MTSIKLPTDHPASRNVDGTWNIHDVPIFGEVPAKSTKKGSKPLISSEWLHGAVKKDAERRESGYTAPLHIRHHQPGKGTPERAGSFKLKSVRKASYEGGEIDVVFADFQDVPESVYQRIKNGALPYRSVEILDPDAAEISSLALLDSEVPFFRFPNLNVSATPPGARFSAKHLTDSPVVGQALGRWKPETGPWQGVPAKSYLFHAAGVTPMDTTIPDPETTELPASDPEVFSADAESTVAPEAETETQTPDPIETAAERMFSLVEQISTRMEIFEAKLAELAAPSATPDLPVTPQEVNEAVVEAAAEADAEPVEMPPKEPTSYDAASQKDAEMHGRLLALETHIQRMEDRRVADARFDAALDSLKDYNLSDDAKKSLKHFSALGQASLDTVVTTFQKTLPKFPAPSLDGISSVSTPSEDEPTELAPYADSPKRLERARYFVGQYQAVGQKLGCSLESFLKTNMDRQPRTGTAPDAD